MGEIKLTDVIAPAFYGVHWDIIDGKHTYYDLSGGRGSTKSSFVGTEIPLGMIELFYHYGTKSVMPDLIFKNKKGE